MQARPDPVARHALTSRPAGDWVRALPPEPLAGTLFRPDNLHDFARAARRAEIRGGRFGLSLSRDRDALGDESITVHGWVETYRFLGRDGRQSWTIGSLARDTAIRVFERALARGVPVALELVGLAEPMDGMPIVTVAVLVPAIHGAVLEPRRKPVLRLCPAPEPRS
ncbi:hypothetical protein [Pararhodobacter sp.]